MKFKVENNYLIPASSGAEKFVKENEGEKVEVKVIRSDEHFNLFWMWIEKINETAGYKQKEELKYWLFLELGFTKTYINKRTGQEILRDESVADGIPKKRLNEIMDAVEHFANEHGISLPDPNNLRKLKQNQ